MVIIRGKEVLALSGNKLSKSYDKTIQDTISKETSGGTVHQD